MKAQAIEIILVRPVTKRELARARSVCAYGIAAARDRNRVMVVVPARSRRRAIRRVWRELATVLPIDALTTVFGDAQGWHLLSVQMDSDVLGRVRQQAAQTGQTPEEYMSEAVRGAVARQKADRLTRLDDAVNRLLGCCSPAEILNAVARRNTDGAVGPEDRTRATSTQP
ncbi:hypothetical protein [Actinacidiphila oryziradicis]|uniref:Uncharacterized protein n=1 Tax=Actinacidiphila oryziradicis TaxID=2571141 RepID=A0A4U0S7V3_9ACTN|nr:hypothetical protein [Actinacidiphila oryziradicis]TJZ96484.1 hypothetical protein FCI23_50935 [Actinacidiphila oryziradicis]